MAYGLWPMGQHMAYGIWHMAYGKCHMARGIDEPLKSRVLQSPLHDFGDSIEDLGIRHVAFGIWQSPQPPGGMAQGPWPGAKPHRDPKDKARAQEPDTPTNPNDPALTASRIYVDI